jgi:hypothetical protein
MFGVAPELATEIPIVMMGTGDEVCEQLVTQRRRWGFSYIVIHEPDVDAFAHIVDRLTGT